MVKELRNLLSSLGSDFNPVFSSKGNVVIDGGFHRGQFSLAMQSCLPPVQCYGFEPNMELCLQWKEKSLDHSGIRLFNEALSDQNGQGMLHMSAQFPATNSLLERPCNSGTIPYYPSAAEFDSTKPVRTTTLDSFCAREEISSIFMLKLDLQGAESAALNGAAGMLRAGKICLILTEAVFVRKYHQQPLMMDIWKQLDDFGYRLHSFQDLTSGDYGNTNCPIRSRQLNQCDCLFICRDLVEKYEQR